MFARKLLLIPVGVFPLLLFVVIARYRCVDPDEGFYLLASRLVFQHKLPYVDFFYTQTPLLPYVYGLWIHVTGESLFTARLVSACLTSVIGILVYKQVCDHTRKSTVGLLAVLLFATNSLVFAWMPIAKTYALSTFFLFASYVIASKFSSQSRFAFLAAGLLFGLSIEVRLYFAGVLPVFLLHILRHPSITAKRKAMITFLAGVLIAMLPSVYLLFVRTDSYVFNNLGYHALRSTSGLIGNVYQKLATCLLAMILGPPGNGPQIGILLLVWILAIVKTRGSARSLAFQVAAALAAVSLLPTPTYLQYWCVVVPFLIVAAVCAGNDFLESAQRKPSGRHALVGTALLAIYLSTPIMEYKRFVVAGNAVVLPNERATNWHPDMISAVSHAIDKLAVPGEKVMSFWPGYIFASKAAPFPGFENDSGLACSERLTEAQLSRYHIVSRSQVEGQIAGRLPRIVVLGNQEYWNVHKRPYAEALARAGYHVAAVIGDTSIYVL